jgi:hypothetical protein
MPLALAGAFGKQVRPEFSLQHVCCRRRASVPPIPDMPKGINIPLKSFRLSFAQLTSVKSTVRLN